MKTKTKGEKIEVLAKVIKTGSGQASGTCPFETSFVWFLLPDGREVKWHSQSATKAEYQLKPGMEVALTAFLYGHNLRRVQVTKGCAIWGMGQS